MRKIIKEFLEPSKKEKKNYGRMRFLSLIPMFF